MAKKPAPLTSDLLVRKGEATPSSIDPAAPASGAADAENGAEKAQTPTSPPERPRTDDGRPQTPEPEIVLAADAEPDDAHGSRRRLAGVLALVAVVTAGFFALRMFGPTDNGPSGPSVAPVGEAEQTASNEEQSVAPIMAAPEPESTGTPAAPAETELRLQTSDEGSAHATPEPAAPIAEEPIVVAPTPVTPPREAATITPPSSAPPSSTMATAPAETSTATTASAATQSASKIAKPGQYLIQLLSVRSETAARGAWTRLQAAHSAQLGDQVLNLQTADLGDRGTYYRVRFGAYDTRSQANAVCTALKATGQDCLVKRVN